MNTILDVLIQARASIADPKNWFGNWEGRGKASQMCAMMAISQAAIISTVPFSSVVHALETVVGYDSIAFWNDSHTHEQVLAGFDKAIAAEQRKLRKTDISPFVDILEKLNQSEAALT